MMDSQEAQALIAALECYFEQAGPDDHAHNAAISRADSSAIPQQGLQPEAKPHSEKVEEQPP